MGEREGCALLEQDGRRSRAALLSAWGRVSLITAFVKRPLGRRCWCVQPAQPRTRPGYCLGRGQFPGTAGMGLLTHLLLFFLRALDATLSTSPIMPMVTWGLMPSLKWTPRPVTSPGAFWHSEMWLRRLGSANTQVCRGTRRCEQRGRGWGPGPQKVESNSPETTRAG